MEPEGSLPHSQVPATCLYPKPAQSIPYPHIALPDDHLSLPNFILLLKIQNNCHQAISVTDIGSKTNSFKHLILSPL
jgi:hypothetical protein